MAAPDEPGLLAAAGTRAVLIACGNHAPESRLTAVPSAALSVADLGRCLVEGAGLDPDHLRILQDPARPQDFATVLEEASGSATDVLLFWYTGHGLVSAGNELHLATRATLDLGQGVPEYQALPYSTIKNIIKRSRARLIVVGLDCCFSGRAESWSIRSGDDPLDTVHQQGVYVLASAGRDEAAWAPTGEYTAFTGAVIRLLTEGDPGAPRQLTLDDMYQSLTRTLPSLGLPRPRRYAADEIDTLPVAPNRAYEHAAISEGTQFRAPDRFSPYRGLAAFEPEDARFFFGREDLTRTILDILAERPASPCPLIVTGPSGCGKSSLLRAGLVSALQHMQQPAPGRVRPPVLFLTPGTDPLGNLVRYTAEANACSPSGLKAQVIADPTGFMDVMHKAATEYAAQRDAAGESLVIVVDQFEEIFAPGVPEAHRKAFIGALSAACSRGKAADLPALVVLGVRADFFGHCASYPQLVRSLERSVVVGPMTEAQLRSAITKPAELAGLALEDGLADLLLHELQTTGKPADGLGGVLPLLSHVLLVTWQQRQGSRLTLAGYRATGGIAQSLARTADRTLDRLDLTSQRIARRLLLRLVQLGDGTEDTRRYAPLGELLPLPGAPHEAAARHVLDQFVRARLLTIDSDTVRITHEALLRAWPQFRAWIDADRASLLARQQLTQDAVAWERNGRETAFLYGGSRLATAQAVAAEQHRIDLSALEQTFLNASSRHARRRATHTRQLIAVLIALTLLAGGLAAYANHKSHESAVVATQASSQLLATEADQVREVDPSLAAQLSVAAYRVSPTSDAVASLLTSAASPFASRFRDSADLVQSLALAPNHRVLAVAAADGSLRLWNVTQPGHPIPLGRPLPANSDAPLYTAAFSSDGHLLAAAGAARTIQLWNTVNPVKPVSLGRLSGPGDTVFSVAFSPGRTILAAGGADDKVWLWDIADPRRPVLLGKPLTGPTGAVHAVAFSPDGRTLVAGSADHKVWLWTISNMRHPMSPGRQLIGLGGAVYSLAFSPSGHSLAAGSEDGGIGIWPLDNLARPVRPPARLAKSGWVYSLTFSPGGRTLAAGGSDDQVQLWNSVTHSLLGVLPSPQPVTSVVWDGSRMLITGEADGMVRLWRLPSPVLLGGGPTNSVSFNSAGTILAVGGSNLQLWSVANRTEIAATAAVRSTYVNAVAWDPVRPVLAAGSSDGKLRMWQTGPDGLTQSGKPLRVSASGVVEFVAFRRDGRVLATAGDDGTVRLWDVADPAHPKPLDTINDAGTNVYSVAFSPDGHILAAASTDNVIGLWDISDPARPRRLGKQLGRLKSYALSVAFSPDGRTLAVGGADGTVRLWDVSNPARPHHLGAPLTGPGGYVYSVAFNPAGTRLAAGITDGTIWMWDVANPAKATLFMHATDSVSPTAPGHTYTVAYSPDGGTLAVGNSDGSVRLWDTRPAAVAAIICAAGGQSLTRAEWNTYAKGRPHIPQCTHPG